MAKTGDQGADPDAPRTPTGNDASIDSSAGAWLDGFAYSSGMAAGVAGALASTAALALALPLEPAVVALATSGTLVVYNIDRLRDLPHDREIAPLRSAFIERNARPLGVITLLAAVASAVCALQLSPATWLLCGMVIALGLLHRRLKKIRGIKTIYLTGSWLAIVLGLPLLNAGTAQAPGAERIYWVSTILGCAILSNLIASNLDRRHSPARSQLGAATAIAGLGIGFALVAPDPLRGLALIPAAEFAALSRFRNGERYRALVLDGGLFAGAVCAIAYLTLAPS